MINNIQDLFAKYKNKINSKIETENKIINILKTETGLEIQKNNLKINQKEKTVNFINLESSKKFILKNKFLNKNLTEEIKKQTSYKIINFN